MPALTELIRRGGEAAVEAVLVIEGVNEAFVSDARRAYLGKWPYSYAGQHTPYAGLDASTLQFDEHTDWISTKLSGGQMSLVINDLGVGSAAVATRVFGGRVPTRRTYLAAALTAAATTVTVWSTEGWDDVGVLHIGREAIRYTGRTATTFTGCTRAWAHSFACAHPITTGVYDIEVTDVPVAVERRRAQVMIFIDDSQDDPSIVWRGIVESVRQTPGGPGYEITLAHVSSLLDQDFGEKIRPFTIRGFYFASNAPFFIRVRESDSPFGNDPAYTCFVSLTGFYPSQQALLDQISAALANGDNWVKMSDGSSGSLPVNEEYRAVLFGGALGISFRADSTTPRYAWVDGAHALFARGPHDGPHAWRLVLDDGTGVDVLIALAGGATYTIVGNPSVQLPIAWTRIDRAYTRAGGVEDFVAPPDRVYYAGDFDDSLVTSFFYGPSSFGVRANDTSDDFFSVRIPDTPPADETPGVRVRVDFYELASYADSPVELEPAVDYGQLRWDELLRALIDATATSGATGQTPWLPSDEFASAADFEAQVLAIGGLDPVKVWQFYRGTSLRDILTPELQAQGLTWTTDYSGRLWVRRIEVTTASTHAAHEYDQAVSQAWSVGWEQMRDGVINRATIKGGYNPREDRYTKRTVGAEMRSSVGHFGERGIELEPQGAEIPRPDYERAFATAQVAAAIVYTHAYPYVHVTLDRIPGLRLANALLGDIVSITDDRVVFRGQRGATRQRGQIVGRTVRYRGRGGPGVDLVVRLTDWNAAAYAPAARVYHSSPLTGTTQIRMRAENLLSDAPLDGTTKRDFEHFKAGDVVQLVQVHTTTGARQRGLTITRITSPYLYVTPAVTADLNNAAKRWIVKPDAWDAADGTEDPPQRAFAAIADANGALGGQNDPAFLFSA